MCVHVGVCTCGNVYMGVCTCGGVYMGVCTCGNVYMWVCTCGGEYMGVKADSLPAELPGKPLMKYSPQNKTSQFLKDLAPDLSQSCT